MLHSVGLRGHLRTMRIQADATPGQSGSPVWLKVNGNLCLVGVLVGAGKKTNTVVRVTRELRDQVKAWIAADGETAYVEEVDEFSAVDAEIDEILGESESNDELSELKTEQDDELDWERRAACRPTRRACGGAA